MDKEWRASPFPETTMHRKLKLWMTAGFQLGAGAALVVACSDATEPTDMGSAGSTSSAGTGTAGSGTTGGSAGRFHRLRARVEEFEQLRR